MPLPIRCKKCDLQPVTLTQTVTALAGVSEPCSLRIDQKPSLGIALPARLFAEAHHLAGRRAHGCGAACRAPDLVPSRASVSPGLMCVMCTSTLPLEVRELVAERCRAQVPADARELALLVAERGLDHQVRDLHRA